MYLLFMCAGFGVWLGVAYELIAALRRRWRPTAGVVFAVDVIYCVAAGAATFLLLLAVSDGQPGLAAVLGLPTGFFTLRKTAKNFSKRG